MKKVRSKLLAGGLSACMLLNALPQQPVLEAFAAEQANAARGDVNGDGKTDSADLEALTRLLGEHVETLFAEKEYASYDITGEGIIDVRDRYALSQYLNGSEKEFPTEYGKQTEDTITLSMRDAACYRGDRVSMLLSVADWKKDIAAYDIVLSFDTALKLDSVEFLSDGGQYAAGEKNVKLSGLYSSETLWRGDLAILNFRVSADAEGDYAVKVDGANIFTSEYNYYTPVKPEAKVTVSDLNEPVSLNAAAIGSKSAVLTWDMLFTDQPVGKYLIYRDDEKIGETAETQYTDTGLTVDTDYVYTITAVTENGAETKPSAPLTVHTSVPQIVSAEFPAPTVTNGNSDLAITLAQPSLLETLTLNITGPDGKKTVRSAALEGAALDTVSYHLDTAELAGGKYEIEAVLTDADGAAASKKVTVEIHDTAPKPVTLSAKSGSGSVILSWTLASEASACGYVVYRQSADGKKWEKLAEVDARDTLSYTDRKLTAGKKYTYAVSVLDKYGFESERSEAVTAAASKDSGAPEIVLFKNSSVSGRVAGKLELTVEASDDNAVASVAVMYSSDEGKTWEKLCEEKGDSGSWIVNTADYKDGNYILKAVAYDAEQHESSDVNTAAVIIDNTPPAQVKNIRTEAVSPNNATIAWDDVADEDRAYFIANVSHGTSVVEYKADKELGLNLSALVPNTQYTVTVYAVDQTGNTGPVSEPFRFISEKDVTPPTILQISMPAYVSAHVPFSLQVFANDSAGIGYIYLDYSQDKKTWKTISVYSKNKVGEFTLNDTALKEGTLYIRAYATDSYQNTGKPEDAVIQTMTVDNTAPETPSGLSASAGLSNNLVEWGKSASEDAVSYQLERAVGADSEQYQMILKRSDTYSYTDRNVKADVTYKYRVAAIDRAGNLSAYSKPVTVTRMADKEAPEIRECYLSEKKIVCSACRTLQIIASDNMQVSSVSAAYRCKDSDDWTALKTEVTSTTKSQSEMMVRTVLPESILKESSVTVQVTAADPSGNQCTEEYTYTVDDSLAEITGFNAKKESDRIVVTWTCADSSKVRSFRLLRQIGKDKIYQLRTMQPKSDSVYTYEDTSLTESGDYTYSLSVLMQSGNEMRISLDPIKVQSVPKAVLACKNYQVLGKEYEFNGTASEKADEITSVSLSYGDGTMDTADSVKQAVFRHTYEKAGVYEAELTVKNAEGFSATDKVTVTVADVQMLSSVDVVVRTTEGDAAANAVVYVDAGTDNQARFTTDAEGKVNIVTTAGSHEIGVFGDGFLPQSKNCVLTAGGSEELVFSVVKNKLVDANFNVKRMTLSEIKAAGINVNDTANCNIVNISVNMEYESKSDNDQLSVIIDLTSGTVYSSHSSGSGLYAYRFYSISSKADTVVVMRVPAKVQFLKDFFQVDMLLMNNATPDFSITDCNVSLNLPSGLTLMEDSKKSAGQVYSFDRLSGGENKQISWIVRGDRSGEYTFSADFSGTLQPFGEQISEHFVSENKISVSGQRAAAVTVSFNPVMTGKTLLAELLVENKSPNEIYELTTDISDVLSHTLGSADRPAKVSLFQTRFIGTDGILKVIPASEKISVLKSGEKFSVLYRISDLANPYPIGFLRAVQDSLEVSAPGNVTVQVAPVKFVNVNDPFYGIKFDKDKDFLFMVKNKNGDEIAGANINMKVTVNGQTKTFSGTTDDRGRLIVPRGDARVPCSVKIAADQYTPYQDESFEFPASKAYRMQTFVLSGDYEDSDFGLRSAFINGVDVLHKHHTVQRGDSEEFSIVVHCRSSVEKFELCQGTRVIRTVDTPGMTAVFTGLSGKDFLVGKNIFVRVTADKGDPFETPLTIEVVEPSPDTYQSLIDNIIETTSKYDVCITVPAPSVVVEWGGDLDLTLPFPKLDDMEDFPDVTWEFTETSVSAEIAMGNDIEFELGDATLTFSIGVSFSASIDMDTDEACVSGTVSVGMSGSAGTTLFQAFEPVPFYVAIAVEASLGASATVQYTFDFDEPDNSGWSYSIEGTAGIAVTPEIGLGVDDVLCIGVYGTAGINISGLLSATNEEPHVTRVWLDGAVGVRGELLDYELFSVEVFSGSITFYPTESSSGRPRIWNGSGLCTASGDAVASSAADPAVYRPFTAEEIPVAGEWNGKLTNGSTAVLRSGISGCSAPVLASDGTNAVLVWIEKDIARGVPNASYAVYSVYDAATGTWSAPAAVDDNQNADTMPVLYAGADGIRIVYQESGSVFEEDAPALNDYAKQLVFRTAKFDAESGSFTDFRTLDANADGGCAASPSFVQAADGTTYLVWRSNQNGLLFGTDNSNAILYAAETEEGWSEPAVLLSGLPKICALTCGTNASGEPVCVYAADTDSNTYTSDDRKLFAADLAGNVTELASGSISAPQFSAIPGSDAAGLVWYQDGKLYASQDFSSKEVLLDGTAFGLTDRFMISGDQVLYLRNTEGAAALFSVQYDADAKGFTDPVCVESGDALYYEQLALAKHGDQTLYAMTASSAEISGDTITRSSSLTGGILSAVSDISISDPQFAASDVASGKALPLEVTVRNIGTTAADSLTLKILDADGNEIAADQQAVSLRSGEEKHVAFAPVLPEETAAAVYTVSVSAAGDDRTPDNNRAALDLSKTDIAVRTELEYFGDQTMLTVYAENESNVPTSVLLHIQPMKAEAETLTLVSEVIEPHTAAFWQVDSAEVLGDIYRDFVRITAETDHEDVNEKNNKTVVVLSKSGFDPAVLGDINMDGKVDLTDAMEALKCYTKQIAHQKNIGLSATQQRCADVDKDGLVDLPDAQTILRYYVNHDVSGKTKLSFEEYLVQEKNGGAEA